MMRMTPASTFVCMTLLSGCIGSVDPEMSADDELVGEAESAVIGENALNLNALNLNALNLNALNLNALNLNGLSLTNLAAIQNPGSSGTLARLALRYMASCALTSNQSFSFSWTDLLGTVHNEVYPGLLGLAPTWTHWPLCIEQQRMVSACLAARVNYYEVPVVISARSVTEPLKTLTSSQEKIDYPHIEGAFWGNLFAPVPFLNACYNSATVKLARVAARLRRGAPRIRQPDRGVRHDSHRRPLQQRLPEHQRRRPVLFVLHRAPRRELDQHEAGDHHRAAVSPAPGSTGTPRKLYTRAGLGPDPTEPPFSRRGIDRRRCDACRGELAAALSDLDPVDLLDPGRRVRGVARVYLVRRCPRARGGTSGRPDRGAP